MTREAVRSGSTSKARETFDEFFEQEFDRVSRFVSRRLANPSDVEDVVAKTFVDAHQGWRKCRGDRGLWVLSIARRRVADLWRRQSHNEIPLSVDIPNLDAFDRTELIAARQALGRLTGPEREVVLLQALEGMSIQEIAEVIGRTTAATNSLLERARRRLRVMEQEP